MKNTNKTQNNRLSTTKKNASLSRKYSTIAIDRKNQDKIRIIRRKQENQHTFKKSGKIQESIVTAKPAVFLFPLLLTQLLLE
jgi:hypothetical protein